MKEITKGILPEKREEDWVGKQLTCTNCKGTIELEKSDKSKIKTDGSTRYVMCPTKGCNHKIKIPVYRSR